MRILLSFMLIIALINMLVYLGKSVNTKKKGSDNSKEKKISIISFFVFLCSVFILGMIGPDKKDDELTNENTVAHNSSITTNAELSEDNTSAMFDEKSTNDETDNTKEVIYDKDEIVNDFIVKYNSFSKSPIIDIEQGNIIEKCYGHTYEHRIEILDGADAAIHIRVFADYDHPDMEELREPFHDVIVALDSSLSDDQVYEAFDNAMMDSTIKTDLVIGNVNYSIYMTFEYNGGRTLGRIEADLKIN